MLKRVRPLLIIAAATAFVVIFDITSTKIDTGEINVPDKYERMASDSTVFAKELAKRVLLTEIDNMFS